MSVRVALLALLCATPASAQPAERITDIRVHGNHTTPEADVLALSGLAVGEEASAERLQAARQQLDASRRFAGVDVRRRYASIADPAAILVVIVVDEHAGVSAGTPIPGPLRRLRLATMWVPILGYADGHGFTYGVRFGLIDPVGPDTRMSVPLSWGGERRAGVELERTFEHGPFTTVNGSVSAHRHVNRHFNVPDVRVEARGRVERALASWLRAGAEARVARVDFGGAVARHTAAGADVELDTRLDPSFPRKAVHARAGWERLAFESGSAGRWHGDLRGYVAVGGANVLALRAQFARVDAPVPPSERSLIGGSGSLRGYRTGHRAGDNLAAVSAEVRVPLTSPLTIARVGVKAFVDAGAAWPSGERIADQAFDRGVGAGVYAGVAAFLLNVDVAWAESGRARGHVGLGVTF
jgi:outer membrane protein assembly factor BamA